MSDLIRVVDLEIRTHIGVPEEERAKPQRLLVTLEMSVGKVSATASDDITKTVDYYAVTEEVKKFAEMNSFKLIETFAEKLARILLLKFAIDKIRLEVKKFILKDTKYVSVVIERGR